jgi:hypothetical protein
VKAIALVLNLEVEDDAEPETLAQDVFDFLCEDPDNLFPAIASVSGFGYKVEGP